jgi:hypothetical protein
MIPTFPLFRRGGAWADTNKRVLMQKTWQLSDRVGFLKKQTCTLQFKFASLSFAEEKHEAECNYSLFAKEWGS